MYSMSHPGQLLLECISYHVHVHVCTYTCVVMHVHVYYPCKYSRGVFLLELYTHVRTYMSII